MVGMGDVLKFRIPKIPKYAQIIQVIDHFRIETHRDVGHPNFGNLIYGDLQYRKNLVYFRFGNIVWPQNYFGCTKI